MSDGYLLDVRFLDVAGGRQGGMTAVCSEDEARQLNDAIYLSTQIAAKDYEVAIAAPWITITLAKAGDKEVAK